MLGGGGGGGGGSGLLGVYPKCTSFDVWGGGGSLFGDYSKCLFCNYTLYSAIQ